MEILLWKYLPIFFLKCDFEIIFLPENRTLIILHVQKFLKVARNLLSNFPPFKSPSTHTFLVHIHICKYDTFFPMVPAWWWWLHATNAAWMHNSYLTMREGNIFIIIAIIKPNSAVTYLSQPGDKTRIEKSRRKKLDSSSSSSMMTMRMRWDVWKLLQTIHSSPLARISHHNEN